MSATLKKTLLKKLLAGSLIFYVFSGVSSVLNYAFYPVIARFVSISDYGEIQFLVSMFTQLAVGFVVLNILAIIISASIPNKDDQKAALHSLTTVSCFIILGVVAIGSIILLYHQSNLGISNSFSLVALSLSLVINVPFTVAIGRLQGNNQFIASGVIGILGALFKLVFSLLFILAGFGVAGAVLGIGVGMIVTLGIIGFIAKKDAAQKKHSYRPSRAMLRQLTFIRERAAVAILAITAITILSTADSIVSRLYLDTHYAGQYAAVATIAKIILALTSPLMWLALPPAVVRDRRAIIRLISIASIAAFTALILFSIFPQFFLMLLGVDAGAYSQVMGLSSSAMAVFSIAFMLVTTSICLGSLKNVTISTVSAILAYFITFTLLSPAIGFLQSSLYGQIFSATCFIIGGIIALRTKKFNTATDS